MSSARIAPSPIMFSAKVMMKWVVSFTSAPLFRMVATVPNTEALPFMSSFMVFILIPLLWTPPES